MNVLKDFKNDLLKRREIEFVFPSGSNPGSAGALKQLVEKEKVAEETIVLKGIHGHYGSGNFFVEAFIYDSVGDKEMFEPKKKEKKK